MTVDRETLELATKNFIAAYRREYVKRELPLEKILPPWEDLSLRDRAAMMRCVGAAARVLTVEIRFGGPGQLQPGQISPRVE